ncbi:MAG: hypothetical protein AAF618_05180 [Pseudomonadota bacterium]
MPRTPHLFTRLWPSAAATACLSLVTALGATSAAASCAGEDFAPCTPAPAFIEAVTTLCLLPADTLSAFDTALQESGLPQINEIESSMLRVLSYRTEALMLTVTGLSDDTAECTVSTGAEVGEGIFAEADTALQATGATVTETGQTWDGRPQITYESAGESLTLTLPEPPFDGMTDITLIRNLPFK